MNLCEAVALKTKCLSRKIGAVLVKNNRVVSTGYNSPPVGTPPCNERISHDHAFCLKIKHVKGEKYFYKYRNGLIDKDVCPRKILGFKSGTGLEYCPAIHAEKNCILSASLNGIKTKGAKMYLNTKITPCSQCLGAIINAGIEEVIIKEFKKYDVTNSFLINNSSIIIREANSK